MGNLAKGIRHVVLIAIDEAAPVTTPAYDVGANEADLRKQWANTLLSGLATFQRASCRGTPDS